MKFIITILAFMFIVLAAGVAIGSNADDENDGDWTYKCDVQSEGRTYLKYVKADDRIEAEYKVRAWGTRQSPPRHITSVSCACVGEASCQ